MTNSGSHIMTTLNPAHLSDGAGSYFVSGTKIKKCFPRIDCEREKMLDNTEMGFRISIETSAFARLVLKFP
jgi:hypothetical protein